MIIRICDVETCGLPPDNMQVVEVATVDLVQEGETWTRGRMWSSLVNPQCEIPPAASGVHHITDDMVKDAPTIDRLGEKIWLLDSDGDSLGSPNFYAAHNAKFEVLALGAHKGSPPPKFICTYKAAVLAWPDSPSHKNHVLRYFLKLNLADPSLAAPHRALGDAYVTAALLRRMLADFTWTPEQIWEQTSKPIILPRLHFGKHVGVPCKDIPSDYWNWVAANVKDDEDVTHTARFYLNQRQAAQRSRSPV
jgi:exodeoxyribonuclease X